MNRTDANIPHRRQKVFRITAGLFAVGIILIGALAASRPAIVWAAMPGRIGAPSTTIDVHSSAHASATPPLAHLAVLGDVGTGDAPEWNTARLVSSAAASDAFDALLLLGDNVYPNGDPSRLDATVFDPFAPILQDGAVLLSVLGNHDVRDGNAAGQVEALGMPGRWYATEVGPVRIISLDSTIVDDSAQLQWLETTLATTTSDWIIVAMHHPAYSAGYHGSTESIQEAWVPLFETYDVDLVLAGHDHDYQRMKPRNGVTYIVSGGGAKTRPTDRADFTAYAASVLHYVDVAVWSDHIDITAYSSDGPFDQVSLSLAGTAPAASESAQPAGLQDGNSPFPITIGIGAIGIAVWALAMLIGWFGPPEVMARFERTVLVGTTTGMIITLTGLAATAVVLAMY